MKPRFFLILSAAATIFASFSPDFAGEPKMPDAKGEIGTKVQAGVNGNEATGLQAVDVRGVAVEFRGRANFAKAHPRKEAVVLKGVVADLRLSPEDQKDGQPYRPEKGSLSQLLVDGKDVELASREFKDRCIVTKDFGMVPVGFAKAPDDQKVGYTCLVALTDEQMKKLQQPAPKPAKPSGPRAE